MVLLFAVDDRRGLSVRTRLVTQLIAAAIAAYTLLPAASWWFIPPIVVAIMWSMNLYNFMDGADGLAGGMTLFGFSAFAIVAASGGADELAAACGCIAGAAAGFSFTIFRRQKYSWATPAQCRLASSLQPSASPDSSSEFGRRGFRLLVFSPFIVDATVTLVRRVLAGKRVWEAHREHLYQRMVTRGWGHARTAVAWYAIMALVVASAIAAVSWPIAWQIALLLGWLALYAVLYAGVIRLTRT